MSRNATRCAPSSLAQSVALRLLRRTRLSYNPAPMTAATATPKIDDLALELQRLVPPGGVLTDPGGLFVYESDGFTVAKARPRAVVFPTSTQEVAAVVKLLARRGVQIIP